MGRRLTGDKQGLKVHGTLHATTIELGTGGLQKIKEPMTVKTSATGTVTHDISTGPAIFWHTGIAANFTANFTNVPTTEDRVNVVTLGLVQGATGYYPNAVQIDGVGQTIRWLGNSSPTPTSSSGAVDMVTFSMIRSSSTWYVTGILQAFA